MEPMNPADSNVQSLLPHRGRMLLIDSIIAVDDQQAITRSVAADTWPLFHGGTVHPIVLIELIAQTAGIHNGWVRDKIDGSDADKKGWVVGIRQARLPARGFAPGTALITRSQNRFEFEGFRQIAGTVALEGGERVARVTLQLLRSGVVQGLAQR